MSYGVNPVRNVDWDTFTRGKTHGYSLRFNTKSQPSISFVESQTKNLWDIMEDMKHSNASAGRILSYELSKDGMSATWSLAYTNVDRIITGSIKRHAQRNKKEMEALE